MWVRNKLVEIGASGGLVFIYVEYIGWSTPDPLCILFMSLLLSPDCGTECYMSHRSIACKVSLLPQDVLWQVLLTFPANELCRLRAVCRLWCSITGDSAFIAAHLFVSMLQHCLLCCVISLNWMALLNWTVKKWRTKTSSPSAVSAIFLPPPLRVSAIGNF